LKQKQHEEHYAYLFFEDLSAFCASCSLFDVSSWFAIVSVKLSLSLSGTGDVFVLLFLFFLFSSVGGLSLGFGRFELLLFFGITSSLTIKHKEKAT
jgi:hypothetical protein